MGHVPHLYLAGPWPHGRIPLPDDQRHHLERVLRRSDSTAVSYTDGLGRGGVGELVDGALIRGPESDRPRRGPELTVAASPLKDKQRCRYLVEKLSELGVAELIWLSAEFTQVPPPPKAQQWADQALEQSRGSWRMEVRSGDLHGLPSPAVVADPAGGGWPVDFPRTVVIGPEGGWGPRDDLSGFETVSLGDRILRAETAAVAAVSQLAENLRNRNDHSE